MPVLVLILGVLADAVMAFGPTQWGRVENSLACQAVLVALQGLFLIAPIGAIRNKTGVVVLATMPTIVAIAATMIAGGVAPIDDALYSAFVAMGL
jgi:hypothetical protein